MCLDRVTALPATLANSYLEGHYTEIYPDKSCDEAGLLKFFRQFSFPGGIGSHCTPETPGSIHEGGELGYSISHAYGAAFDNPDLIVAVAVGDGEAETGPLATSWHSNKFLNPIRDGAVLPILHLNGYKIANPDHPGAHSARRTGVVAVGYGHKPYFVEGNDPALMHQAMASTLEQCILEIRSIQATLAPPASYTPALAHDRAAFAQGMDWAERSRRPQGGRLLARPPGARARPGDQYEHLKLVETGCAVINPKNSSTRNGTLVPELQALAPEGARRISANPHANGGLLRKELELPDFRDFAVDVKSPAVKLRSAYRGAGTFPCGSDAAQHDFVPRVRPRRNGLQPSHCDLCRFEENMAGRIQA